MVQQVVNELTRQLEPMIGHDRRMEADLVRATWGLVAATALLVVAAIIPILRDAADRRERRRILGAKLVPDINLLHSRLVGGCNRLREPRSLSKEDIEDQHENARGELKMLGPILREGERPSLIFANEIYLARHLLTQATYALKRAHGLADEIDADDVRQRDDALFEARRNYKAALMSLNAAEQLLPRKVRTIRGESFWDRFARVSDERKAAAERSFIEIGKRQG